MDSRDSKVHNSTSSLFCWLLLGLVVWPRLGDPVVSQNPKWVRVSHSPGQILGCAYDHLFVWSNFLWITLPTQLCLVLYSFCASLLHSFIIWQMVSFLSPHNLHLLFYYVLSILALIWLVLMTLFWAAIRRDSVYLLRFSLFSHIHVFLHDMLLICRL